MAGTIRVFDFEMDINGAQVIVKRAPICPGCLSVGEVDAQIALLKADLDAVAKKMKAELGKPRKSLFGNS